MSMQAMFVQVDSGELSNFRRHPAAVEVLFDSPSPAASSAFADLATRVQERLRSVDPVQLADAFSRLDPAIRSQIEQRLGRPLSGLAAGGGEDLLRLMQERASRRSDGAAAPAREVLSLEKNWHGVHYLLCGAPEPSDQPLSRVVMGGAEIGDDPEGFSGYGPPRCFTAEEVAALSRALSKPVVEAEAANRFDAQRMSELGIYPGWRSSDAAEVMDSFRKLRDFYHDAADKNRAIITCLV